MSETTSRANPRAPEFRMASGLFRSLRQDLITDAFAYRPLAPMRTDGPVTRRLPARIRPYLAYLPHAVIGFIAFFVVMLTSASSGEYV
ncbi:two-component sensor histidine kinase, partial [Streptomyces sp. SID13726]|nr:two-component sensor histidine kinase [Streptomyces sp. SID13726]